MSLGHHVATVTRSRKGRTSFVLRMHGKQYAPVTDSPSGLAGASSIDLANIGSGILSMNDDEARSWLARIAGNESRRYLLGTHGRAFAQVTPTMLLTGGKKAREAHYAHTLANGTEVRPDFYRVAVHTADIAGWLTVKNLRDQLDGNLSTERDHDGRLIRQRDRYVTAGSWRKHEQEGWQAIEVDGKSTGQYVRSAGTRAVQAPYGRRTDGQTVLGVTVTECHSWADTTVRRKSVTVTRGTLAQVPYVFHSRRATGRRFVRYAIATVAPERTITAVRDRVTTGPPAYAFHGSRKVVRPRTLRSAGQSVTVRPPTPAENTATAGLVKILTVAAGSPVTVGSHTVTVTPGAGGKSMVRIVDEQGVTVANAQLRGMGAIARRVLAVTAE